jgi:hypothetical protein
MDGRQFLVTFIDLAICAAALTAFMRRDRGIVPEDRLPDALKESTRSYAKALKSSSQPDASIAA